MKFKKFFYFCGLIILLATLIILIMAVPTNNKKIFIHDGAIYNFTINKRNQIKNEGMNFMCQSKYQQCIEENICTYDKKILPIYHYCRTNFDSLLSMPIENKTNVKNTGSVFPKKVHFVLFGEKGKEFKFYYMLAIIAASRHIKPKRIYFWHDNLPTGDHWTENLHRVKNIYLVKREKPTTIFGRPIKLVEHSSDIARLEILLEYGGIYLDTDSIAVRSIDPLLKYDITLGRETYDALANGMIFSKPWSAFLKLWYYEYKNYNDEVWGAFSVLKPNELSKLYLNLLHIEETSFCRPNHQEKEYLFGTKQYDWRSKNYIVHLYMRFSDGWGRSYKNISTWKSTVGQVMRYIYNS